MPAESRPRELWFTAPRTVELRTADLPVPGAGQLRARALASGLSQGTELLLYRGQAPTPFDPSLDEPGTPTYPRRYGYAWVGRVTGCGPNVDPAWQGRRVFALAPHGDVYAHETERFRALADDVPDARAVLTANLETAVTCVWDSRASLGDEVVVLGAGVVGLLVTWLLAQAGARVRVVEPSEKRRRVARELGARASFGPDDDDAKADADVVIEATGDPAALERAIAHAATEATIVVASFYGTKVAPVKLGSEFHRRRLTLRASQVSTIPHERAPRWSLERRAELVQRLLGDSRLDALIDDVVDFAEAPSVYARLDRAPGERLQTVFTYR